MKIKTGPRKELMKLLASLNTLELLVDNNGTAETIQNILESENLKDPLLIAENPPTSSNEPINLNNESSSISSEVIKKKL